MRLAEFKKVSTRTERRIVHHDEIWDDNGNLVSVECDETVDVEVPVMGMVYRDATPEEIAELERQQAAVPEPTPAEMREHAYNTDPCVPWGGEHITVTEAAQQWAYYAAEGNSEKMDALTALIYKAKRTIREQYPDTETEGGA